MGMRSALMVAAALFLSGCSLGSFLEVPAQPAGADEPPQTYYRQLVAAAGLSALLTKDQPNAQVQISGLRRSIAPQPGDWMTCLTATGGTKQQQYLAIFFRNREVINSRFSVAIDHCDAEQYAPLPTAAAVNEAAASGSVARTAVPSGSRLPGLY